MLRKMPIKIEYEDKEEEEVVGAYVDCRLEYRDWSKELAYALKAFFDSSESWTGSVAVDEVLRIEKMLDCELDGVRTGLVLRMTGEERGLEYW